MNKKTKLRIFTIISIIILCIGVTFKLFQNDTFYIIKLGEDIIKNGIDHIDHYCWITKLPYTYPHWLYDIIIYSIYKLNGFLGIYISVIISYIIFILIIYYIHLKTHKNEFLSTFIAIISTIALNMFAVARSQILTIPLFTLEIYFINKLLETNKNKYILYLMLLSLLIANLHATVWLFYFILYLPFIGEFIFYKLSKNKRIRKLYKLDKVKDRRIILENIPNLKKLLLSMGLTFLMGLLTPSRICYTYVFRVMLGNSQNVLLEHFPLTVIQHPFFLSLSLILMITLIFTNTKVYLREIFLICGLIFMSFMSIRHLSFFYTIGVLYISIICIRALYDRKDKTLDILGELLTNNKVIVLLLIIITSYSGYRFYEHSKEEYVERKEYPVKAVEFIKKELDIDKLRLYNNYNYGSYLLFRDIPVFIDSRCDLYLKEFNGMKYSIFDELEDIAFDYEERFEYFDVTHALLEKKTVLSQILKKDKNYKIIYKDKYFILFEKIGDSENEKDK